MTQIKRLDDLGTLKLYFTPLSLLSSTDTPVIYPTIPPDAPPVSLSCLRTHVLSQSATRRLIKLQPRNTSATSSSFLWVVRPSTDTSPSYDILQHPFHDIFEDSVRWATFRSLATTASPSLPHPIVAPSPLPSPDHVIRLCSSKR